MPRLTRAGDADTGLMLRFDLDRATEEKAEEFHMANLTMLHSQCLQYVPSISSVGVKGQTEGEKMGGITSIS